jgi:hypothetical protein
METKKENKINIGKIIQAGKAIKAIFTAVLSLIICFIIGVLVVTNSTDLDTIKNTYIFIGILGLILNIFVLYNLYEAGDNLVNVNLLPKGVANYNSIIADLNVNNSRTGKFAEGGIIVYTDQKGEHGLVCSKIDLGKATWDDAINLCESFEVDGFSDWRLPNNDELMLIQDKLFANNLENNSNQYYWSATEAGSDAAWLLGHGQKHKVHSSKQVFYHVLAVRSF